ncbi:MAG: hypothetical protein ACLQA5_09070 [Solirubrobacteraceae bacterium]
MADTYVNGEPRSTSSSGHVVTVTVVLADDHAAVRTGLWVLLDAQAGVGMVAQAGDAGARCLIADRLCDRVRVRNFAATSPKSTPTTTPEQAPTGNTCNSTVPPRP